MKVWGYSWGWRDLVIIRIVWEMKGKREHQADGRLETVLPVTPEAMLGLALPL